MGRRCHQAVPVSEWQSWVERRRPAELEQGYEPRVFQALFKALSHRVDLSGNMVFGHSSFPPRVWMYSQHGGRVLLLL